MSDEKVTKAKLYTFAEMKDAVAQTIADMAADSVYDSDYDNPSMVATIEMVVGAKILSELDEKHEKGKL